MTPSMQISRGWVLMSLALVAGCTGSAAEAPPPPTMPAGWVVISDQTFDPADIKPIAVRLGGQVASLRNTEYEVNGKPVKLNTIVGASAADTDRIMTSLRGMKPDDFLFRTGTTVYEFVGKNDVIPVMRSGKAHLQTLADPG